MNKKVRQSIGTLTVALNIATCQGSNITGVCRMDFCICSFFSLAEHCLRDDKYYIQLSTPNNLGGT